ncbi:MAG: hypothetical protein KZQ93_17520 [Candidatus Thiodiazotropha sp. (ex Monitilora ramsayi)]|nr:hypothetical protein [Candidatus Thiodiazotropha sp. (ex Monitilora ramsayi)]
MIIKQIFLGIFSDAHHGPLSAMGILVLLLSNLALVGCGGGGTDSEPVSTNARSINGVASKGIIHGGLVRAYAVNSDGTQGLELDSAQTDLQGQYSLEITGHTGPVILEVTGGSYTDEATGSILDNTRLRAVIPPVSGNRKVAITPLTEIAVQIAGESLTLSKINNANAAVSVLIGGADITEVQPQDINGDLSGATQAEKDYTMVLAAVSQMVEDGSAVDVSAVTTMLSSDLEDDGRLTIGDSGVGDLLQGALMNFIASDENNTGLIEDDLTLDEALVKVTRHFVLTKIAYEHDGDSTTDEVTVYGYNIRGKQIMTAHDGDWADGIVPDGVADQRTFSTYDINGKEIHKEVDSNGDGVIDSFTGYTYNINNQMTLEEVDTNNDGIVNKRITWTHTQITEGTRVVKEWDNDLDDVADLRFTYEYDVNGNKTLEDRDYNADGVNNHYTWTYDENGYLVMFESDGTYQTSPDGNVDARYIWTNNADGKRVLQESDSDANGTIDSIQTWAYNASGQVTRYDFDYDLDGVSDEYTIYTYDEYGNLIKEEGTEPLRTNVTYTWRSITEAPNLFSGSNGVSGSELWTTDATESGTNMVKDIDQSAYGSFPEGYTSLGNISLFWAYESTTGYELWASNGTELGTYLVKDLWLGSGSSNPYYMIAFKSKLYFSAIDYANSRYLLHVTDGTPAGTKLLLDRDSNLIGSPSGFIIVGDNLMFTASDGVHGHELWLSDGTEAGTYMLKDINPGADNSSPGWQHVIDGKLYFAANDGVHASELWGSDGTEDGTHMVKDINPGYVSSGPSQMAEIGGGKFIFRADGDDAGTRKDEIWVSDGTEAGTELILDPETDAFHGWLLASIDGKAIFSSNNLENGTELWISDGTADGTRILKDINPGVGSASPNSYFLHGGKVYFSADDGTNGIELWVTDGTASGTYMVKDINPGVSGSSLWDIRSSGSQLYFAADDGTHGNELWISDGTEAGTKMVKDINPGLNDGYIGVDPDF